MRMRAGRRGQRDERLPGDDRFELFQPRLVMRKDGIADELFLLQLADDRPVVGFRVALLLADRRGDRLHLFLDLVEGAMRHSAKAAGGMSDAELLEVARVEAGGSLKSVRVCGMTSARTAFSYGRTAS